ncbi:HNH endonuclease [Lactiplantibacillus plantarum]|nr:HNH endonuclease [Lactiplantibacillus plantarum]
MAKPMKQCEHPGCRTLVAYGRYHKRMYDSDESKYQQFYKSSAWRKLSRRFLESNPVCVQCYQDGVIRKADVVDHVIEIKDDWSRRLDESNLQPLCYRHHNRKTGLVREQRKQPTK